MKHTEWIRKVTQGDSERAIGKKANVPFRTINSQLSRGSLSAENVISVAIGYGVHPVRALVDTGFLDAKYATEIDPASALRLVTEDDLADEVLRRMKLAGEHEAFTTPVDDLAARRRGSPASDVSPGAYDPERMVADSSPDEDQLRGDDDGDWTDPDHIP